MNQEFKCFKEDNINESPLIKSFNMQTNAQLDGGITRILYIKGIPFNLAKNPYYASSY